MTTYKQGDIVLVPFPFTDLSISADWYNQKYEISEKDFRKGNLYKKSILKLGKIFTQGNTLNEILTLLTTLFHSKDLK